MGDRTFAAFVRGLPVSCSVFACAVACLPRFAALTMKSRAQSRRSRSWFGCSAETRTGSATRRTARTLASSQRCALCFCIGCCCWRVSHSSHSQRFFHGTHVIRSEFGVDSLAVSGRLFGSVASALLSSNFLIELWAQNAAGGWEPTARASPGDPRAIEQVLQEHHLSMPDLAQQTVMGALYATGGASAHDVQIGLAYMDVNSSKVFVTQNREGPDLAGLSAVVAASGVRECLLPAGVQADAGSAYGTIAGLLESCGVKVTQVKRSMFQAPSMEVEQELERLLLVPDGSAQLRQQAVQSLLEMPLATTACVALVSTHFPPLLLVVARCVY